MMGYFAPTAAAAAFLGVVCLEGFAVFVWRMLMDNHHRHSTLPHGAERLATRRAMFLWLSAALLMEAGHDMLRAGYFVWQLEAWPHALSFWFTFLEAVAVLGLIRIFTARACGEWGWTIAAILPLAAAMGVLFR